MARPNLSYLKNLVLCLVGFPCGLLSGLTGIGASVLVTPLTRRLLSLGPGPTSATALAATFAGAVGALLPYSQTGNIRWALVLPLVAGQLIGATWGQGPAQRWSAIPRSRLINSLIVMIAGVTFVAFAPSLVQITAGQGGDAPSSIVLWIGSAVAGLLAGFLGRIVGLGVFVAPAEILLLRLKPLEAQGTALVALALASLPGMLIYRRTGAFDAQSATWIAFGGLFGGLVGAYNAAHSLSVYGQASLYGGLTAIVGALWAQAEVGRREAESARGE